MNKYLHKKDDDGLQKRRVASFLPSSTEILYELELADQIVGVTHECNYPEEAKTKPNLINSSFDTAILQSIDIDKKIAEMMRTGQDIYVIDDEKLKKVKTRYIITQGICDVCAPSAKEIALVGRILLKIFIIFFLTLTISAFLFYSVEHTVANSEITTMGDASGGQSKLHQLLHLDPMQLLLQEE